VISLALQVLITMYYVGTGYSDESVETDVAYEIIVTTKTTSDKHRSKLASLSPIDMGAAGELQQYS
jgi:hypothetical protein